MNLINKMRYEASIHLGCPRDLVITGKSYFVFATTVEDPNGTLTFFACSYFFTGIFTDKISFLDLGSGSFFFSTVLC